MNLQSIIYEYLLRDGLTARQVGFTYLIACIEKTIEKGTTTPLRVNGVYKEVSEEYDTKYANVERNIRYSLRKAGHGDYSASQYILEASFKITKEYNLNDGKKYYKKATVL